MTGGRIDVLEVAAPGAIGDVQIALRELVARAADHRAAADAADSMPRTWAILGELAVPDGPDGARLSENDRVIAHDLVGRLAVRLAVDKTLCVGEGRAVRALHQGAVMEGSWGDEVRMVGSLDEARAVLRTDDDWRPAPGDVVLLAGAAVTAPASGRTPPWRTDWGHDVVITGVPHEESAADSGHNPTTGRR